MSIVFGSMMAMVVATLYGRDSIPLDTRQLLLFSLAIIAQNISLNGAHLLADEPRTFGEVAEVIRSPLIKLSL